MKNEIKTDRPFLTVKEAAEFLGLAVQTIYQKSHNREIPHYKPSNKNIYFKKSDLLEYVLNESNLIKSDEQIEQEVIQESIGGL